MGRYTWAQHVPLNVRTVINRPGTDPQHAGLAMSLYHSGTALARHMPDDLQRALLHYAAQFAAHVKEQFNEAENLGSQQMRDKVSAMATAPATTATSTTLTAMGTTADETTAGNP